MNVLILGGTQFVGRHIAEALLAAGHAVTVFNRGQTSDELPRNVERLRGDRDNGFAGLNALTGREWDVCVDVSGFTPRQVRPSSELLASAVRRYVFISAVSVYGDPQRTPVDEMTGVVSPANEAITEIDRETYGPLKVTCENVVRQVYGSRSTLLRPQIVAGPYDPWDRFSYWARRATLPGEVLAPGDGFDHLQFIDARDLARFVVKVAEANLPGIFNLAGPRLTWAEFMSVLGIQDPVWAPAKLIKSAGLTENELPLYRPRGGARSSLMCVSNERAVTAELTLTKPEFTIKTTQKWLSRATMNPALSSERERELIRLARESND